MDSTAGEPYKKEEDISETGNLETRWEGKNVKGEDFKSAVADAFSKTPISKMFLVLSLFVYAIIAYSKKESGVQSNDLSMFLFFSIFIILIFIFLAVSSHIYRKYLKFFLVDNTSNDLITECLSFILKKSFLILILIVMIFVYLLFKSHLILLFNNNISWFGNL